MLLGLPAAEDEPTMDFLIDACAKEYWQALAPLWTIEGEPVRIPVIIGECITALALSGRDEAANFLTELTGDTNRVLALDVAGAIVGSGYLRDLIVDKGVDFAAKQFLFDFEAHARGFDQWVQTSSGSGWYRWALQLEQTRSERNRAESRSSTP